jgi:hypothetical protein
VGIIKGEFYLTLSIRPTYRGGPERLNTPKTSKNKPSLGRDEIVMKLCLEVPSSLFSKPSLEAKICVPADQVSRKVITPEIQDNIKEAVKQSTGLDLNIKILEPGDDETKSV